MSDSENRPRERVTPPQKRPYRKPKLEVYGELGQITGAVGHKGGLDGATGKVDGTK